MCTGMISIKVADSGCMECQILGLTVARDAADEIAYGLNVAHHTGCLSHFSDRYNPGQSEIINNINITLVTEVKTRQLPYFVWLCSCMTMENCVAIVTTILIILTCKRRIFLN